MSEEQRKGATGFEALLACGPEAGPMAMDLSIALGKCLTEMLDEGLDRDDPVDLTLTVQQVTLCNVALRCVAELVQEMLERGESDPDVAAQYQAMAAEIRDWALRWTDE